MTSRTKTSFLVQVVTLYEAGLCQIHVIEFIEPTFVGSSWSLLDSKKIGEREREKAFEILGVRGSLWRVWKIIKINLGTGF